MCCAVSNEAFGITFFTAAHAYHMLLSLLASNARPVSTCFLRALSKTCSALFPLSEFCFIFLSAFIRFCSSLSYLRLLRVICLLLVSLSAPETFYPKQFIMENLSWESPRSELDLDLMRPETLSYLRFGALYESRYSMSVINTIFGYLES